MANREEKRHSLFAIRYSLLTFKNSPANQPFHMPDVLPADFVGDGTDAAGARHGLASEEQVIAGADQAGVEQHRIDLAELAGLDALAEQAAMKIQQGCYKEFRDLLGGSRAGLMQQIMDQPVHVGKAVIGADDA